MVVVAQSLDILHAVAHVGAEPVHDHLVGGIGVRRSVLRVEDGSLLYFPLDVDAVLIHMPDGESGEGIELLAVLDAVAELMEKDPMERLVGLGVDKHVAVVVEHAVHGRAFAVRQYREGYVPARPVGRRLKLSDGVLAHSVALAGVPDGLTPPDRLRALILA